MDETSNVPKLRFKEFSEPWENKKIRDVAKVVGGGTPSTQVDEFWNGDIDWYTPSEVGKDKYISFSERKITNAGLNHSSAKLLPKHTILLSSRATIGELSILLKDSTTNQGFQSLIANKNNNYEFIYYLIFTIKNELIRKASGSTFLEISKKEIEKLNITIPLLKEQEKITTILSLTDKKIDLLYKKLSNLKDFKKYCLQNLFADKSKLRFKFDHNFSLFNLGDIAIINKGFTPSTRNEEFWSNGKHFWLSIKDMDKKYLYGTSKKITDKAIVNKKIVNKDTLIMSFKLSIGKLGIIKTPMFTNEAIANFSWKRDDISTEYMYYYLKSINLLKYGSQAAKGITLNNETLKAIPVKLFSFKEQEKIASFLLLIDKKIDLTQNQIDLMEKFKKGLLQEMFV